MPTKARDWPNNQIENRDNAAEAVGRALRAIIKLLAPRVSDAERLQSAGQAVNHLHTAARWLERAGARTTPDNSPSNDDSQ